MGTSSAMNPAPWQIGQTPSGAARPRPAAIGATGAAASTGAPDGPAPEDGGVFALRVFIGIKRLRSVSSIRGMLSAFTSPAFQQVPDEPPGAPVAGDGLVKGVGDP